MTLKYKLFTSYIRKWVNLQQKQKKFFKLLVFFIPKISLQSKALVKFWE